MVGGVRERRRNYAHNIPAARSLRQTLTATEAMLWEHLRDRRLDGLKFRRQHAVERFVLDFYCHELRLAVDGRARRDFSPRRPCNGNRGKPQKSAEK